MALFALGHEQKLWLRVLEKHTLTTNTKKSEKYGNLVIIGSGPVGMVSALMLKEHFENVILLERQTKESFLKKHGFTFPIVFTPAAIKVLAQIGVWEAINAEKSEFFGVVVRKRIMGKEFTFSSVQDETYSHWRNHIVAKLYERMVEENIPVHFEAKVEDIDFQNNVCRESQLGVMPFDLLLGADGINSQTRRLMSQVHPKYEAEEFRLIFLDNWFAYRLPAQGALKDAFGGGDRYLASNVFVDNVAEYPKDKFRIVTTSMKQPDEEISVLIKHDASLDMQHVKKLNKIFIGNYVDSREVLEAAWNGGYAGKFEQVETPTFFLNHVLLVGDAAHGFESTGDLINMGITSIASFCEIFKNHAYIPNALQKYDATVGESLRFYAKFSLRRSYEKIAAEVSAFEIGNRLGITSRHPGLFGIFEDDFEVQAYINKYKRDLRNVMVYFVGLPLAILALFAVFGRKRP